MTALYDVCGVGNAIVDVIAPCTDAFLDQHGIAKGAMTLIFDEADGERLYRAMNAGRTISGGSGANSIAGIASLGGKGAYIGKVADDELGRLFRDGMAAEGVAYDTVSHVGGPSSARCLINVTPDGQRSMTTYLGCSPLLTAGDLDEDKLGGAQIVFLEGYLFDRDEAKAAFVKASEVARKHGRKVALSLSDLFCVSRHGPSFRQLVENHIDILFANESEILALYGVDDFAAALAAVRTECDYAVLTRSEQGAVIAAGGEVVSVPADRVEQVVDTTGAGDLFAAGVLFGIATGREPEACARLGAMAAAEVISHFGARPEVSLKDLAAARGL
jgi:sugar/nucleoside kinase (ribokinase family)